MGTESCGCLVGETGREQTRLQGSMTILAFVGRRNTFGHVVLDRIVLHLVDIPSFLWSSIISFSSSRSSALVYPEAMDVRTSLPHLLSFCI
jgi:hypothetical protein